MKLDLLTNTTVVDDAIRFVSEKSKEQREPEDTCLYKRIFLDYTYGIGKIYTKEEIEKAKQSPSFEREYNLKISR